MRMVLRQRVSGLMRPITRAGLGSDDGQILVLILGYVLIAVSLVVMAVDVTAVYLARTQLLDASDATALDAADAVDRGTVYAGGVSTGVPLTSATVRSASVAYLSTYTPPTRVEDVRLTDRTGTPDGLTAVVELSARVRLPLLGPVVRAWSGGITVTVRSRARADVNPP
jgi:Putative Flp pilus-assembly TadE/G-like